MSSTLTCATRLALVAAFAATTLTANAQTASSSSGALEEIVVTAQKREQNSQDIGISLSAITGADLNSLGAATATDITKSMPAVVLTQPNGPSSFSLAIRGVTQGTLFGRNATGGLANFVTNRPTDELGGYINTTFGQRNLLRVEGAVNGPLSDGVNARLSFESNHYDPLFTN